LIPGGNENLQGLRLLQRVDRVVADPDEFERGLVFHSWITRSSAAFHLVFWAKHGGERALRELIGDDPAPSK
jgi:hypothetical protein